MSGGVSSSKFSLRMLVFAVVPLVTFTASASAADGQAVSSASKTGAVVVKIDGLPKGERPVAVLRGPGKLRRSVPARGLTIKLAKVGKYTLTLAQVRIARAIGPIKAGATAKPARRTVSIRVATRKRATLRGRYGSIINPGVKSLTSGAVVSVFGPAGNPTAVVLRGRVAFARDAILSLPPSDKLPRGLLSHVEGVSPSGGNTRVALRAASVYEVAPNFEFDVPLSATPDASSAAARCSSTSGVKPYRTIKDISISGGWNTWRVLGQDVPIGVRVNTKFTAEAGVNVTGGLGISCSLTASISANGMAGPIPVTAGLEGELTASAAVGGKLSSGGSLRVSAGARTIGTPPALLWLPEVGFSDPKFSLSAQTMAEAKAGIGVGVKIGLGNDYVASATIKVGASVDLTAKPGACSWDARFGQFSAGGKVLSWNIETPKTPALFTKNLWRGCAGLGSGTSPPANGSTPGGPVTPPPVTSPPGGLQIGPVDRVTALTPTAGPGGFAPAIAGPPCAPGPGDAGAMLGVYADGEGLYTTTINRGDQNPWIFALQTSLPWGSVPTGTHRFSFDCQIADNSNNWRTAWTDSGFDVTLTSEPSPVILQSASVKAGSAVSFVSGAPSGTDACPELFGLKASIVNFSLYMTSGGAPLVEKRLDSPHAETTVPLAVPADTATGQALNAFVRCSYLYPDPSVYAYFDYLSAPVLVVP